MHTYLSCNVCWMLKNTYSLHLISTHAKRMRGQILISHLEWGLISYIIRLNSLIQVRLYLLALLETAGPFAFFFGFVLAGNLVLTFSLPWGMFHTLYKSLIEFLDSLNCNTFFWWRLAQSLYNSDSANRLPSNKHKWNLHVWSVANTAG